MLSFHCCCIHIFSHITQSWDHIFNIMEIHIVITCDFYTELHHRFLRCMHNFLPLISVIVKTAHDDIIKWKLFPCYQPFVWGIHQSPVNSPHKGPVTQTLMFLWCESTKVIKQTVEWPVIWDYMTFIWCHRNEMKTVERILDRKGIFITMPAISTL